MKFEELSKEYQEFLMYCLFDHIKHKVKREERDQFIEPTYEEYEAFFDEFDGEYKREDGLPESDACKSFEVKLKVVLEVDNLYPIIFFYNYFQNILTFEIKSSTIYLIT